MSHLLVTNDFPPKIGGIQSYLYELWRRLPPGAATVYTTAHPGADAFDAHQPFRVVRSTDRVLWPTPHVTRTVAELATSVGAGLVLLDPALPIGHIGRRLPVPYGVVLHGAEVTLPGRLPGSSRAIRSVLTGARLLVAAGSYPAAEAARVAGSRTPTTVTIPPGVDHERFLPLDAGARRAVRERLGLPVDGVLVVSVSRLVPRKGMDVLVEAVARLAPSRAGLHLAIGGAGRDRGRLERLARRTGAPVTLLGRVDEDDLPGLYGAGDVYAMCCRNRWLGLEQEGFGIVFLEAASCGVAQLAGLSGGADEAVVDGETGVVVRRPGDPGAVATALGGLVDDGGRRARLGEAARARAVTDFDYDDLAGRLQAALEAAGG